jgi:hypothetical protein
MIVNELSTSFVEKVKFYSLTERAHGFILRARAGVIYWSFDRDWIWG